MIRLFGYFRIIVLFFVIGMVKIIIKMMIGRVVHRKRQ